MTRCTIWRNVHARGNDARSSGIQYRVLSRRRIINFLVKRPHTTYFHSRISRLLDHVARIFVFLIYLEKRRPPKGHARETRRRANHHRVVRRPRIKPSELDKRDCCPMHDPLSIFFLSTHIDWEIRIPVQRMYLAENESRREMSSRCKIIRSQIYGATSYQRERRKSPARISIV